VETQLIGVGLGLLVAVVLMLLADWLAARGW
jgi:hypothetical protein